MYLIRAETNFRLGTIIGASLNDINRIRTRALASTFLTLNLNNIRERELELEMEGFLIHDLKNKRSIDINADGTEFYFTTPTNWSFLFR
jgi:hypothetical protein